MNSLSISNATMLERVRLSNKKNGINLVVLSFFIPILVLSYVYYTKGIYPEGPNTLLIYDMKSQYMPFFASLRYLCEADSDNSLFLNMSGALGSNFMGFAYYIFSPLTWITTLFSLDILPDVLYFLTLLRIGLCGGSFCYYLDYTNANARYKLSMVMMSCCYALMSYNIAYSMNIMWLDAVCLLPLILTGIEKYIKEERAILFIIAVFLSIVSNYYISFMSAVFAIGYLCIRLSELEKWNFKRFFAITIYACLGIGMAMPILLPGVTALSAGRMAEEAYPLRGLYRYDLLSVLGQLTSGKYNTVLDDGLPFIFCGTATIVLALIYFFKGSDSIICKLRWALFAAFYLFAMCFIPLDRVMHGFQETTCFEVRYGYCFSCLLLILAYRGVRCIEQSRIKHIKYIRTLFAVFVIIELFMNTSIIISELNVELHYGTRADYDRILNSKRNILKSIDDGDFYRISENTAYTYNDAAWLGYNGFGYFSSCYNLSVMNFLDALGEDQSHHILRDRFRTPIEEDLLGAKYRILYVDKLDQSDLIATDGLYSLYKNDNALSLGYMIQSPETSKYPEFGGCALENQNLVAKELSGVTEDIFIEIPSMSINENYTDMNAQHEEAYYEITDDMHVWAFFEIDNTDLTADRKHLRANNSMSINGSEAGEFIDPYTEAAYVKYLGRYKEGDKLLIEISSAKYRGKMRIFELNEEVYREVIEKLGKNQMDVNSHANGNFQGIIDAGNGGEMLLSLPYMDGWRIKVDGKNVDYTDYRDALIVIPLQKGQHLIEASYQSPGVIAGWILGIITVILWLVGINAELFKKIINI